MLKRCDGFQIEFHFALAVIWRAGLCCGGYRQQVGKTFQKSHCICTLTQMTDVYQSFTCVSDCAEHELGETTRSEVCSSAKGEVTVYGVRQIIKQSTTKVLVLCFNYFFMYLFIQQFFFCQLSLRPWGKEAHVQGRHILC